MEQFFIKMKKHKNGLNHRIVKNRDNKLDSRESFSLPKVRRPFRTKTPISRGTFENENSIREGSRERKEIRELFRESRSKSRQREALSRDKIDTIQTKIKERENIKPPLGRVRLSSNSQTKTRRRRNSGIRSFDFGNSSNILKNDNNHHNIPKIKEINRNIEENIFDKMSKEEKKIQIKKTLKYIYQKNLFEFRISNFAKIMTNGLNIAKTFNKNRMEYVPKDIKLRSLNGGKSDFLIIFRL